MFITSGASKRAICVIVEVRAEVEKYIFSKSLLGTTMQDGSIKEKMDNSRYCYNVLEYKHFFFFLFDLIFFYFIFFWIMKMYITVVI